MSSSDEDVELDPELLDAARARECIVASGCGCALDGVVDAL
jgi:hypothetical protein